MNRSLLQQLILYEYRYKIGYGILFFMTFYSFFWRLGTLVPGLNFREIEQATLSTDLSTLASNPLDPLYRILQWASFQVVPDPLVATRAAGALLGVGAAFLMYKVITTKFSARVGIVTTIMFVTSSWLLSYARFSDPAIAVIFLLLALMYTSYKAYETKSLRWLIPLALVAGIGLYHRWFIYFLIIGIVVSFPIFKEQLHLVKKRTRYIFAGVSIVAMLPLILAIFNEPDHIRTLLNLPESLPSIVDFFRNIQTALAHVFWQADPFPAIYIGNVPMLDIFSAAMVALGLYHLDHEISKTLSRFVLISFAFSFVLLGVNINPFAYAVMIPFVYVLLAAGLVMLIGQWNEIFPKNPIARTVAFIPLSLLALSVMSYHHERYFLAWPRTTEVIQEYPESIGRLNSFIKETSDNIVVIGTEEEFATYEIVTRTYEKVQYITAKSNVQVLSAQTAIVTPDAAETLPENLREQLPPKRRLLSSSSSFEPTLFVVFSQE